VEPCKGEWCLPGGFIELGESSEEAALRELREETNLRARCAQLLGVSTRQSPISGAVLVLGYVVDEWDGEEDMRPDSDASELAFYARPRWPVLAFSVHRDLLEQYAKHKGL
jgi:ADP-ribose pyrophosphatase YjhB (NUDIX family)